MKFQGVIADNEIVLACLFFWVFFLEIHANFIRIDLSELNEMRDQLEAF